jgi:hypothetical protein
MITSSTRIRFAVFAAATLLLAGCKSGSSGKAASTIPGSAPAPATAGNATAADDGSQAPVAAASGNPAVTCQQLTLAQVQPFIGEKLTKDTVQFEHAGDLTGQQCRFSGASGDNSLSILVLKGSSAAASYASEVADEKDGQIDVPGVGDKASRDKGGAEITALKGDVYCTTGMDDGFPAIGTLESAANGTVNIGEDNFQVAAIAAGTLCNRIFGSGNTTPDLSKLLAAAAVASASAGASASAQASNDSAFASAHAPAGSS